MMDIQEVVDSSSWPDVDSQPLSLEDSWRLRVASAQVYSIVRSRDMEHFERALSFLDATYRLLPRLVAAIKHMKILFGLKTMVIMWMLKEGRGMVDTVSKILQFFPSKLPQYQDQCSRREMFLMRKNHVDFKDLTQALAVDEDRREDYIKNQMEEQYGEPYAQKVEDRLLHYLRELEAVLPGDTYIDKLLKKQSPVTEEEKLLLDVITSDSTTIATTLKKLLHCDVASCRPARISPERGKRGGETSDLSASALYDTSSKAPLTSGEARTAPERQPEVFRGDEDSPLLLRTDTDSDVSGHQQPEEDDEVVRRVEEERGDSSSPQFCSKHQRWVTSILRECPDECSEELQLQANVSSTPPLFPSSSSTSSSQDLTPSNIIPAPPDQPPPPTSTRLPAAAQASEPGSPKDKLRSGSPGSAGEALPQPSSCRDRLPPALLSPVVRLVDIRRSYPAFKPHQPSLSHFTVPSNQQTASASSPQAVTPPHRQTSGSRGSMFVLPETPHALPPPPAPVSQDVSTGCSRKFRRAATRRSQAVTRKPVAEEVVQDPSPCQMSCPPFSVSGPVTHDASTSTSPSACTTNLIPSSAKSPQQVVSQNAITPHPRMHNAGPVQSKPPRRSSVVSSASSSACLAVRPETSRVQLRLSMPSQAVLLQSKLLQPYVSLTRLSAEECYRVTAGRTGLEASNDEEEADSSFDLNTLYSSYSSSGDGEDSHECDPNYKPCIKKQRLLLEYEAARVLKGRPETSADG